MKSRQNTRNLWKGMRIFQRKPRLNAWMSDKSGLCSQRAFYTEAGWRKNLDCKKALATILKKLSPKFSLPVYRRLPRANAITATFLGLWESHEYAVVQINDFIKTMHLLKISGRWLTQSRWDAMIYSWSKNQSGKPRKPPIHGVFKVFLRRGETIMSPLQKA